MCLGIPGEIIEVNQEEKWAIIDAYGVRNKVYTLLVDEDIVPGDFLMVHAGYAIGRIDAEEANRTLKILEEIASSYE